MLDAADEAGPSDAAAAVALKGLIGSTEPGETGGEGWRGTVGLEGDVWGDDAAVDEGGGCSGRRRMTEGADHSISAVATLAKVLRRPPREEGGVVPAPIIGCALNDPSPWRAPTGDGENGTH